MPILWTVVVLLVLVLIVEFTFNVAPMIIGATAALAVICTIVAVTKSRKQTISTDIRH